MQFLPFDTATSAIQGVSGVISDMTGSGKEYLERGQDFLATFNKELEQAGVQPLDVVAGSGAPRDFRALQRESEKVLNDADIEALRDSLKKRGVQEADLAAIDALLESGNIPGMGSLMSALAGFKRVGEELSGEEQDKMNMLLRKLNFGEEDITSLNNMMQSGANQQALKAIRNRLDSLDADSLDIERSEMAALLRGLDISGATRKTTLGGFGSADELAMTPDDIKGMLGFSEMELARKENSRQAIAADLRAALDDVLRTKKQRESEEPMSNARGDKKTDRAEARMRDAMSAEAIGIGPEAMARRAREEADAVFADEKALAEEMAFADDELANGGFGGGFGTGKNGKAWFSGDEQAKLAARNSRSDDTTIASAFSRVSAEGMFSGAAQGSGQGDAAQKNAALPRNMDAEIFEQVQRGILKGMQNGSRQLTLRLDPAELGQVTVMLTVNKGDVKAIIRAESVEATAALSEQMSQLKASLEEQGLKVSQLEVQTQLKEDPSAREWAGSEFHNQEQEMREQARFQQLARIRREAGEDLAQDMQSIPQREEISPSGLHIVA